jgi:hypothetical protein
VKGLIFVCASAGYAEVAYFIYVAVLLQCGLGPDSPAACDAAADKQSFDFAVRALVFYAVLSVGYWRCRSKSKG